MNNKTNAITAKIVDYRYIGKAQLNADDMGGVGCSTWDEYLKVCDVLTTAAWDHTMGKTSDDTLISTSIAGLLDFFGISYVDSKKYMARILAVLVGRKAQRSDKLKDAIKDKTKAKQAWEQAILDEKSESEQQALKEVYEQAKTEVDDLYAEPKNYWFDPAPMFNKKTKRATEKARKAIEDTCADIFTERQFMSADEIQKEQQALDDQRKGRKIRQKEESKAQKITAKEEKAEVHRAVMDELQERGVEVDG